MLRAVHRMSKVAALSAWLHTYPRSLVKHSQYLSDSEVHSCQAYSLSAVQLDYSSRWTFLSHGAQNKNVRSSSRLSYSCCMPRRMQFLRECLSGYCIRATCSGPLNMRTQLHLQLMGVADRSISQSPTSSGIPFPSMAQGWISTKRCTALTWVPSPWRGLEGVLVSRWVDVALKATSCRRAIMEVESVVFLWSGT